MREIQKEVIPVVLNDNKTKWTQDYIADPTNGTKRYRYRHLEIKGALKQETSDKCVYCESKIGHNTPGDVEHKVPSSHNPTLHFEWSNLTIACTECNRRKNAYFDAAKPFLDPYNDPVETSLVHHGPIVCWEPGNETAEITIKILKLDDTERVSLILRKIEKIASLNTLIERISHSSAAMRPLLLMQLEDLKDKRSEYSGMVRAICASIGL